MTDDIWVLVILVLLAVVVYRILSAPQNKSVKKTNSEKFKNEDVQYAPYVDDGFTGYYVIRNDGSYWEPSVGWLSRRGLLPWWNSTRDTKNMSYDLRGDIYPVRRYVGPWLNSSIVDRPYGYRELY